LLTSLNLVLTEAGEFNNVETAFIVGCRYLLKSLISVLPLEFTPSLRTYLTHWSGGVVSYFLKSYLSICYFLLILSKLDFNDSYIGFTVPPPITVCGKVSRLSYIARASAGEKGFARAKEL
jgi:hypothetical protein